MRSSGSALSIKIPIAYIDVRVFSHATEDLDKVLTSARSILPEQVENAVFNKAGSTGHHGNPIVLIEARIKDKHMIQAVLEKLASGLGIMDKELLGNEVADHLEKGNLYLRIDKQSAFRGVFRFNSSDSIHLRIHFKKRTSEEVVEICRKFGLLP